MRFTSGQGRRRPHDDALSVQEWETLRQSLGLSLLQTEIIRRLIRGKSHQEIAREMAIRPRTVQTVVSHLYHEFGVSDHVQLILRVLTALREHWEQEREYPCP